MVDKRRFQNLERARPERPSDPPPPESRLAHIEVEAEPTGLPTGLARERFEEPVQLATVTPDAPLFHRCHVCGADNQRSDVVCRHCTADLRTAAQQAFDAALRRRELDEERREHERGRTPPPDPVQQVALGKAFEELIAEEREQRRPPGWRLLRRLPGPWPWIVATALAAAYLGLFRLSARSPRWLAAWAIAGFVGLLLFAPAETWTRTVRRYDRWF